MTGPNQTDAVHQAAITEELQIQRAFFGDRAVNLAAELAGTKLQLQQALAKIARLESAQEPELGLEAGS